MGHRCWQSLPQTQISRGGGVVFHEENTLFPVLTLKRAPSQSRMASMDRTHATSSLCSVVTLAVSLRHSRFLSKITLPGDCDL